MSYIPNVLLLDQDPVLRRATALLLSNRGASVSTAATLEDAVALSRQRVYDVALVDLAPSMPRPQEILKRLRGEGMAPRRIVFCAEQASPCDDADDGSDVLLKPYPFERLLSVVFGERGARKPTRSGVFPRLRLIAGGLGALRRAGAGEQEKGGADAPARLDEEPSPAEPCVGGIARLGRRGRGNVAARSLRSPRRAPRGARHPG